MLSTYSINVCATAMQLLSYMVGRCQVDRFVHGNMCLVSMLSAKFRETSISAEKQLYDRLELQVPPWRLSFQFRRLLDNPVLPHCKKQPSCKVLNLLPASIRNCR